MEYLINKLLLNGLMIFILVVLNWQVYWFKYLILSQTLTLAIQILPTTMSIILE